ncbi:MAG: hypothetical protein KC468_32645, partial [Myxococcales bacterium]|nr:hypothetical protein [Myxococcales bacterium]
LELLEGIADLPWRAAPIYDREAFTRPDALHHVPYWERDTGPLLMFVDDEAAAREVQRRFDARVLPATTGVVLEVGRVSAPGFRAIHRALCRGCFYPPRVFGADRGFFVYEHATPGVPGPYVRRQFPRRPIKRSSLDVIADFDAGDVEFDDLRFADLPELQPVEDCDCRSPGIFFSLRTRAFAERDRRLGASAEDHRRCARRVPGLAGGIRLDRDVNVDSDTDPGVPQRVWLTLADAAEAGPTWDLSWPEPEALEVQFGLDDARARAGLEIARSSRPRPAPAPARPQRRGRARAMTPLAPRNRCARATSRRARCHSERPMDGATMEARVVTTNNVLIRLSEVEDASPLDDFCGTSFNLTPQSSWRPSLANKTVYLCGDIAEAASLEPELRAAARVFVVRERSRFDADRVPWPVVGVGRVPVLVHGAGVLYRRFFEDDRDLFHDIRAEHSFQSLTQSNKPGTAHRTGLYLTPVERDGDALRFRLLRCSTNLSGPTANFGPSDRRVVDALNEEARAIFADQARLNHVLAQIYWNTPATERKKQTKAKINGHADKTKDMPANGIMAFCTFYDQLDGLQPLADDPFDRGYKRA